MPHDWTGYSLREFALGIWFSAEDGACCSEPRAPFLTTRLPDLFLATHKESLSSREPHVTKAA